MRVFVLYSEQFCKSEILFNILINYNLMFNEFNNGLLSYLTILLKIYMMPTLPFELVVLQE